MKYGFITDENNYVVSIYEEPDGIELPENFDFAFLSCYQFIDDEIILDEEMKNEIERKRSDEKEIFELKQKLNESDYIFAEELEEITALSNPLTFVTDLIAILIKYSSKYKEVIINRKKWRERIKELGG